MKCRLIALVACLGCLLLSSHAMAWNQTMTCDDIEIACNGIAPVPVYWPKPCVSFHLNELGSKQMNFSDILAVVSKSIKAWNQPKISSLQLNYAGLTNEDRVGYNPYINRNANIIVFRDDKWDESRAIMALTSVTHHSTTGIIYDADIEINTATYKFGIVEKKGDGVVDLQNTLTHEIGHTFGLAHSNVDGATMSIYAANGETNLRTLEQDDLDAIAAIYPPKALTCDFESSYFLRPNLEMDEAPPSDSDCAAAVSRPSSSASMLSLWMVLLACLLGLRPIRRRV